MESAADLSPAASVFTSGCEEETQSRRRVKKLPWCRRNRAQPRGVLTHQPRHPPPIATIGRRANLQPPAGRTFSTTSPHLIPRHSITFLSLRVSLPEPKEGLSLRGVNGAVCSKRIWRLRLAIGFHQCVFTCLICLFVSGKGRRSRIPYGCAFFLRYIQTQASGLGSCALSRSMGSSVFVFGTGIVWDGWMKIPHLIAVIATLPHEGVS